MPDDDEQASPNEIQALLIRRHRILSTALPFPNLDWSQEQNNALNLKRLRGYCEGLANSVLDWYLEHHNKKKWKAKSLHNLIFAFVALAGFPPLLKVALGSVLTGWFIDAVNSHAGEISLGFIGIAGALKIWDANGAYTSDWMRFIT